ncbi:MAG: cobalamin biosynthesis protein [Pseudomonadota bacterium]
MFDVLLHQVASPERIEISIFAILMVVLVGMISGPSGGNANPFLWFILDKICGGLIKKTYNVDRSVESLKFRGSILLIFYLVITGILAALAVLVEMHFPLKGFAAPILLALTLSGGATWSSLIKLHQALSGKSSKSKGSYYQIAVSTRSNLNTTDDHGIIRIGIGFVATNLDKGFVAPLFWFLIGGLPAAYIYTGIVAARWSLSKDGFAKGIGHLALNLESIFGVIPQILTTILIAAAALLTPTAGMTRAVAGLFSKTGTANYAEGGFPLTALAWALGLSLGGPVEDIHGSVLKRDWVGPATSTARLDKGHLRHAIYLSIMAYILVGACLIGGLVLWKAQAASLL